MSYEYKDTIQDSVIHYYDHVLLYNEFTDDVLEELDHVYTQAAKADEYEAKAKAFDALYAEFDRVDISLMKADFDEALEYERGEIS